MARYKFRSKLAPVWRPVPSNTSIPWTTGGQYGRTIGGLHFGTSSHQARGKGNFKTHKPDFLGPSQQSTDKSIDRVLTLIQSDFQMSRDKVSSLIEAAKSHVVENSHVDIRPLQNYKGNMTRNRLQSLLNVTTAAMEADCGEFSEISKLHDKMPDLTHFSLPRKPNLEARKFLQQFPVQKVIVGTGTLAALKAWGLGAAHGVCCRIKKGSQNFYITGSKNTNYRDPNNSLIWNSDRTAKHDKTNGIKGKVYIGIGIEGARRAQALGAGQSTCSRIFLGKQNSYEVGGKAKCYEKRPFSREITPEVEKRIRNASRWTPNYLDREMIIQESSLYYATTDVDIDDHYIERLVGKVIRIMRLRHFDPKRQKNILSLNLNGDIELANDRFNQIHGRGIDAIVS